jgi:glycosyltransferase involved in cell wall biosynthesis
MCTSKINILFLGFYLPDFVYDNALQNDKSPAIQTKKFISSFSKVLEYDDRLDIEYVSTRAISTFPSNSQKFVYNGLYGTQPNKKNVFEISFINITGLKLISRFISSLFTILNKSKNKKYDTLLVYSVHLPFLLTGLIASRLFGYKLVGLWTDPPAKTNSSNLIIKFVRSIESFISKKVMAKFDKSIVLSKHLALDYNPRHPFFVLEGILDSSNLLDDNNLDKKKCLDKNCPIVITYAGTIVRDYGIEQLVKAVGFFDEGEVYLNLYGAGCLARELEVLHPRNVFLKGFVGPHAIGKILKESHFLMNCRSPKDSFTKYSFPSKTIEYMSSGTPVIMTMLDGIPETYREFVIALDSNEPEEIYEALKHSITNYSLCLEKACRAKEFIKSKSCASWSKGVVDFVIS